MNTATFDTELSDAFEGGAIRQRELRLGSREAAGLRDAGARVTVLAPSGDKFWYEIAFQGEDLNGMLQPS